MIKGDKIKLVKPMGAFTNIGEVCEVIDVSEGGVVSFKFGNGLHLGCMSYDEFLKYFEMVETEPERVWSSWKPDYITFTNLFDEQIKCWVECRDNGKKIQVRADGIKAESTCSKYDKFDYYTGRQLAHKRFVLKYLAKSLDDYAKNL